jgi:transcriptional regulator with XRE-family HTH domain
MRLFLCIKKAADTVFLDTVARRIREMRSLRGMSRQDLAQKCEVSFIKILLIECNMANIDIHTCEKLGRALDISWLYLVGITDEKKPVTYGLSMWREDWEREWKE